MSQPAAEASVIVLNGPNLNLLGTREPELYGAATLGEIADLCSERAAQLGLALDFGQTNHEGELVSWVQQARGLHQGMVINPAGLGHTSIALLDALKAFDGPVIEVHLSNLFRRESFRHHSYVSSVARGVICGLGAAGYLLALDALAPLVRDSTR